MKLDSSLAWQVATRTLSAHRDLVLTLAGVFLLLPHLALTLFVPPPQPQPGMAPQAMMALLQGYYLRAAPFLIAVTIIQAVGTLSILTLFTDRSRPTVAEAIKRGVVGMVSYIGAQLLFGVGFGVIGGLLLAVAMATKLSALIALVVTVLAVAAIYITFRLILTVTVIAVDGVANPVSVLQRSWVLTKGNIGRIFLFIMLLGLIGLVILASASAIIGLIATLVLGAATSKIVVAVVASGLTALFTLVLIAVIAAIHRQLAGPSVAAMRETFS